MKDRKASKRLWSADYWRDIKSCPVSYRAYLDTVREWKRNRAKDPAYRARRNQRDREIHAKKRGCVKINAETSVRGEV